MGTTHTPGRIPELRSIDRSQDAMDGRNATLAHHLTCVSYTWPDIELAVWRADGASSLPRGAAHGRRIQPSLSASREPCPF